MRGKIRLVDAHKIWSLESESPQLWRRLKRDEPSISAALTGDLKDAFPVAPVLEPYDDAYGTRPAQHHRAFYIKQPTGSVIAVKGSEAAHDQLDYVFHSEVRANAAGWPPAECFPLQEQKLPYAVHVSEAIQEARVTVRFLEKYLQCFDTLPMFPLHLSVYRMPEAIASRYFATLYQFVSERCRRECHLLGQEGLAVYAYHFPVLPIRIAHIVPSRMLGSGIIDAATRESVLRDKCGFDAQGAIENFLALVGRMLSLGFFPLSRASYGIGYCTSAQNVTIGGGMVDSESLVPFEEISSDSEFSTIFLTTLSTLSATAKVMLYSPLPCVRFEFKDPSPMSMLLSEFIWASIRSEVESCIHSGLNVDPRLQQMLANPTYDKLYTLIHKMYPRRIDRRISRHVIDADDNRGWD